MDDAFRALLSVGIATLTMVLSMTTSSTARHSDARAVALLSTSGRLVLFRETCMVTSFVENIDFLLDNIVI